MSSIKVVSPESLHPFSEWKRIGCGQFGDVFKVKHKELRIHVAVKKLKENVSYHLKELLAEAEKIKHASEDHFVVRLFGIVKTPPCIVMELTENGCLGKLMERVKEIPWPLKYRFIFEVSLGMNWLHSLSPPLLHLDLKPRNVLLNDAFHIRITDFGLSKYISSSKVIDDNDDVGGTLAYMPPEAFQEGYSPSMSTDVYSFAILSAVLLRGEDPYPVPCSALISLNIPQGQRPSFESLENTSSVKNLDEAIEFTKQCWHNDKQERPSFDECCNQWEKFKSAYESKEIQAAVTALQTMINDSTDSSCNTTDVQQSASTPNSKDMSDMIRDIEALNIAEPPSAMLEAIPPAGYVRGPVQRLPPANQLRPNAITHVPSTPNYRPGTQPVRNSQNIQMQYSGPPPGSGLNHRANSSVYRTGTQPVRNTQIIQRPYSGPPPAQVHQTGQSGFNHRANSSGYRTGSPQSRQHLYRAGSGQAYPPRPNMFLSANMHMPYGQPAFPGFPMPIFQDPRLAPPTPGKTISVDNMMGPCQIGDNNSLIYGAIRHHQTTLHNPMTQNPGWPRATPTQTFNIIVRDSKGPLQIGDNNAMVVRESSQYQESNTIPITPQTGQSAHSSPLIPANSVRTPQQSHTSQVNFPTKAGEDFSDVTHPTQDTKKQTDQPQETMQGTTGNNSLQGKDDVDSSSCPREQGNNSKQ